MSRGSVFLILCHKLRTPRAIIAYEATAIYRVISVFKKNRFDSIICQINTANYNFRRSQWPRGQRRGSAAARLLRSWVRIPPRAWMFVCCECCVLSGRGLYDELITHPEKSYRMWYVVVCDLETSRMRSHGPRWPAAPQGGKIITSKWFSCVRIFVILRDRKSVV